jgi:hypothetical protein
MLTVLSKGFANCGIDFEKVVGALQNETDLSGQFCHNAFRAFFDIKKTNLGNTPVLLVHPKVQMTYQELRNCTRALGGLVRDDYIDILVNYVMEGHSLADFYSTKNVEHKGKCFRLVHRYGDITTVPMFYDVRPTVWVAVYDKI